MEEAKYCGKKHCGEESGNEGVRGEDKGMRHSEWEVGGTKLERSFSHMTC